MALVVSGTSATAEAHHSFAMYDSTKLVTVDGTVTNFQWTNSPRLAVADRYDHRGGSSDLVDGRAADESRQLGPYGLVEAASLKGGDQP